MVDIRDHNSRLSILVVLQGRWGTRIAENVDRFRPPFWHVYRWVAPRSLPAVIDDPEEFLPRSLPAVDLILALGETPSVPQLIPDIVRMSGARAVVAPIDRNESLPPGLVAQLQGWLADLGVAAVFPKPFCSLTETAYNWPPISVHYDDPTIRQFAAYFGQPQLRIDVDEQGRVACAEVERDSACGCARAVAQGLSGCPVDRTEYEAGMLHHHFPCLASMNQDADYQDTLMHVSGHILREAVQSAVRDHLSPTAYLRPIGRVGD
jgi:hypothetical protein